MTANTKQYWSNGFYGTADEAMADMRKRSRAERDAVNLAKSVITAELEAVAEFNERQSKSAPVEQAVPVVVKRISVTRQQDNKILEWLKSNNCDPLKLPVPPPGKAGVKKECGDALCEPIGIFTSRSVFNTAWERLRANRELQDAN